MVELNQEVTVREVEGVTVVEVGGRALVCGHEHSLIDPVERFLAEGKNKLLIDLTKLERFDETGLGQLAKAYCSARDKGAGLRFLVDSVSSIHNVLVYTKLNTLFEVFHDEAEAVKSFSS